MCLTGTLLRNVLVLLFLVDACGKRRCNYREILVSYREFIFVELQNLNLTGSFDTSKGKDPCPPGKAHRILVSIYGMAHQMRCQRSSKSTSDLERPLESMEQLISQNCSPDNLGKKVSCSAVKKIRGKKRKRIRFIKVIKALITCWQKLIVSMLSH
ncbi:hypothetical protein PBY51_000721 [Eleginops maclovinus]|uniref:Interleukin-7 n=1 Tax=Eleginops maclovinus TaxID=56733 RepID=A0AAN8AIB2_ELEMC|nr:hypothetical protein PBY51_000721 [Eleginops maclovinus]